jgi:hypothetical protein
MQDYIFWKQKPQSGLLATLANLTANKSNSNSENKDGVINLPELSPPHLQLLPALRELSTVESELREPCDVWIKAQHHSVSFPSVIGRPRFLALHSISGVWTQENEAVDLRNRFLVAILGGLSLIVPMLIMVCAKAKLPAWLLQCGSGFLCVSDGGLSAFL